MNTITLRDAVQAWKQEMRSQFAAEPATADQHIGDIVRFATWMIGRGRSGQVGEILPADALAYRDFLAAQGKAPAMISRSLESLQLFMEARGQTGKQNPFSTVLD